MRILSLWPMGPSLLLAASLVLVACDTAEERAENHYQRAIALLAEGDEERAMIEFRNVFRRSEGHTQARLDYARLLRDRGELPAAFNQYQRLVEHDRTSLAGLKELTELALRLGDLDAARENIDIAFALAADDPEVRALKATLDFANGGAGRVDAVEMARSVLDQAPDNLAAQMVLIADRLQSGDPEGALVRVDAALARSPEDEGLRISRLAALEAIGDSAGVGAELETMVGLFPDNAAMHQALIRWHMREGNPAAALEVLRTAAARHPEDPQGYLTIVQFLYETEGPAAARAELDKLIAGAADATPFRRTLAGLDFSEGRTDEAIAALTALLEGAPETDGTRDMQVMLAGMLDATGDTRRRDELVEAVLAGDPAHVPALKMRARAEIAADRPERAVADMRTALGQAPRDPEVMTIMGLAHDREGSPELAGERFAMAVETSNYGTPETLRYARFLMQTGRAGAAEGVVLDALRRAPAEFGLLEMLGRIHLERGDWTRARQVAGILRREAGEAGARAASELEIASLRGEDRRADAITLLEGMAAEGGDTRAMAQLMRAFVEAGDLDAAETYVEGVLAADPADLAGRQMMAGLRVLQGDFAAGEALYREIIAGAPELPQPHHALATLLAGTGQREAALAALDAGIEATGGDGELLFFKAGLLEVGGDFDGAIAIYEALYARDSASMLVANNLASLLTTHRADPESLERAFAIARRLRGSDVPHFQDTYGWIMHLRGDSAQALTYLEPAARVLGDNPLVQFHLGEALLAAGRPADARASFARAVDLAGPDSTLPQIAAARTRVAEIDAGPQAASGG